MNNIFLHLTLMPILILSTCISCRTSGGNIFSDLPSDISPDRRYLFYLHGRIIEEKGIRPVSPEYGTYEYEKILAALSRHGFIVISEARKKNTDVYQYAGKVTGQVKALLDKHVPPRNITVVGASKGGIIAMLTSARLQNRSVNFVLMASCFEEFLTIFKQQKLSLRGNILSIYDGSDSMAGTCREFVDHSLESEITAYREIRLNVGTGHGMLYRPLKEWIDPVNHWARRDPEKSLP